MSRDGDQPASSDSGSGAIPPAAPRQGGRIAVVVNGNAKSVSAEVIATLDQILDGGDLYVSRRIEDSEGIAKSLLDRGYDTILTGGGDGTFTVVVTAVVREARARGVVAPRFGLLRLGTGNSLAWVLGASKTGSGPRVARALSADIARLRADAGSRPLALLEVEGMLSPFCGFGIDANVLHDYAETKKLLAHAPFAKATSGIVAYAIAASTRTIPQYLLKPTPHCRVVNRGGDVYRVGKNGGPGGSPIRPGSVIYEGPATIAAVSTIPYYGFGFRMFPHAEERPGKAALRVSTISSYIYTRNFGAIWRGEYYNPEVLFDYFVDAVEIEFDPPTNFQIGGDIMGERTKVLAKLIDPIPVVDFYAPPRG
jgi:diacylglycerol kinase family enzyme